MRHPEGTRFERRLRARQEARRLAEESGETVDERRQRDRRAAAMTPNEVEAWLKHNNILGGDRRKGERRQR